MRLIKTQVLVLSKADRKRLEADLAAAEPYDDEEMYVLDGTPRDPARVSATMAKKFLKEAEEEEGTDHSQR